MILSYLFNLARKWNVLKGNENPASGIPVPPDVQRNRYLDKIEIKRLVETLAKDENKVAAKAILLLLLTGRGAMRLRKRVGNTLICKHRRFCAALKVGKISIRITERGCCCHGEVRPSASRQSLCVPLTGYWSSLCIPPLSVAPHQEEGRACGLSPSRFEAHICERAR